MLGRNPALVAVMAAVALAQQDGATRAHEFEVASVRQIPGPNIAHGVSFTANHGRLSVDAATLKQIAAFAYGVQNALVQGGAWRLLDANGLSATLRTLKRYSHCKQGGPL